MDVITRCPEGTRRGNKGVSDVRAAEVVELATILTHHQGADEPRAALTRIAHELLRAGADATLDQALEAAPSCAITQTLQHALEAASERVVIRSHGANTQRLLFTVPIITCFEQAVPESQFESALHAHGGLAHLAFGMGDDASERTRMALLRSPFRLDELTDLPLSTIRQRAITFDSTALNGAGDWHRDSPSGLKRCTTFLRFLVGQQVVDDHDPALAHRSRGSEGDQKHTAQALSQYLGLPCRVRALHAASFHEGLYAGMWSYQAMRLDQLARAACLGTSGDKASCATVVAHGRRHRFEVWLGFFAGNEAVGRHAYRLKSRPSEDPGRCVSRITRRLEAAGIHVSAAANLVPEERRFSPPRSPKVETSRITVSI